MLIHDAARAMVAGNAERDGSRCLKRRRLSPSGRPWSTHNTHG